MDSIELRQIQIDGMYEFALTGRVRQRVGYISATFEFGKAYGLIGELVFGAPAISWCVAGRIVPRSGVVLLDGEVVISRVLRKLSHTVWVEPGGLISSRQSVETLIMKGLKRSGIALSLEDLIDAFGLERLNRPLYQCSNERWRASAAIGFSQGKSVFCFPWMWHEFVARYKDVWMGRVFDFLKGNRCLVLAPTSNKDIGDICDVVMHVS